MELLALALVNVITAILTYVVFAVRLRLSLDRARREPLVKELRENIEMAMEYLGTSVDLMDRKNRTFYQLVQRAEAVAEKLERSIVAAEQSAPKKSAARKKAATAKRVRKPRATEGPADPAPTSGSQERAEETTDHVERLLARLGRDEFAPTDAGPVSGHAEARAGQAEVPAGEREPGLLGGLGRLGALVGRVLGVAPLSTDRRAAATAPQAQSVERPTRTFQQTLSQQARTVVRRETVQEPRPGRAVADSLPPAARVDISDAARRRQASPDPADESGAARPENPGAVYAAPERDRLPLSGMEQVSLAEPLPPDGAGRRLRLRELLEAGYSPRQIAEQTGLSVAEIELTASLPVRTSVARRQRHAGD